MNQILREFLHWSIGFAVVSTTAIVVVHLFASKRRRAEAAEDQAGGNSQPPVRRPIWGAALLVLSTYLFLLGPVLQGIGRAFQTKTGRSESAAPTLQSSIVSLERETSSVHRGRQQRIVNGKAGSGDCPCRKKSDVQTASTSEESAIDPTGRDAQ